MPLLLCMVQCYGTKVPDGVEKKRPFAAGSPTPVDADDEVLAARAIRGDDAAISALYRRYADRLWRQVIWPIVRDEARCEDALCESFLAALQALPAFEFRTLPPERSSAEPPSAPSLWPWLKQIARRKALDQLRLDQRKTKLEGRISVEPQPDEPGPQDLFLDRERAQLEAERVAEVLEVMNRRYALALRLRLQEGLSREDCAERLEIKVGNFDVLLHRAARAFRDAYAERFGSPDGEAGEE
jgi:RNA polymerase sigma factor (sigma-70 family)